MQNKAMEEGPHYVRVLGPLEVLVDGHPAPVAGRRKRALLAALSVRGGRLVSTDDLVEAVWPDDVPVKALAALRVHVSHLRRMLRVGDTAADPILTGDGGYGLMRCAVDAVLFERSYQRALTESKQAPEKARVMLAEGLGLWRADTPLSELGDVDWVRPEITRLIELRREGADALVDLRLRCGEHANLIPELEASVEANPLSERCWAQLMLALYRAGQQSRALDAFNRARRTLVEELGIVPAPALAHLEHQILTHDPNLIIDTSAVARESDGTRPDSASVIVCVRALGPNAQAIVEAAAVLRDRAPLSMLSDVSGIEGRALLAALDECERSELIDASGGEAAIANPVLAAEVVDDMERVALADLHARSADALRRHPLADPDRQVDALARHSVGALGIMPATGVVNTCLAAARRAEDRAAFDVAGAHYRNARLAAQHLAGIGPSRLGLRAAIGESESLIRTGAVAAATPVISSAIDQARSLPDPELFADAVLVANRQESMIGDHPGGALQREALRLLPEGPSPARTRLLALLAISLVMTDRTVEREALARDAVSMARTLPDDPALLAEALAARYQATFHAGNLRERIAWATEASQAALRADDQVRAAHTLLYCAAGHIEDGDRAKTDITLRAAELHAERAADARFLWASDSWRALMALADANYDEGEELGSRALARWGHTPNTDAVACHLTQQTMVAFMQADWPVAIELLTGAVAVQPDLLAARLMLAYALAHVRPSDADRLIGDLGPNPMMAISGDQTELLCWAMLAETAGVVGPRPWLRDLVSAMPRHADQHVVVNVLGGGGIYWGCLGYHLGTAQLALGHDTEARISYQASLTAHQRFGTAWWTARTSRALAVDSRSASGTGSITSIDR